MARSSTSPRDLHDGLVKRLRAGEAISAQKVPSHRLATAARRLRKEGVEVVSEKVVLNPGKFPALVTSVYSVPKASRTNGKTPSRNGNGNGNGNGSPGPLTDMVADLLLTGEPLNCQQLVRQLGGKVTTKQVRQAIQNVHKKRGLEVERVSQGVYQVPAKEPVTLKGGASADIRRRLLEGEELSAGQISEDYGIHKANLSQIVEKLRKEGYLVTVRMEDRRAFYRSTAKPVNKARPIKAKVPKWVQEAEEEEEANAQGEPLISDRVPRAVSDSVARLVHNTLPRVPRLLSVVSKTELVNGEVRLMIQDGDEFFEAVLI